MVSIPWISIGPEFGLIIICRFALSLSSGTKIRFCSATKKIEIHREGPLMVKRCELSRIGNVCVPFIVVNMFRIVEAFIKEISVFSVVKSTT